MTLSNDCQILNFKYIYKWYLNKHGQEERRSARTARKTKWSRHRTKTVSNQKNYWCDDERERCLHALHGCTKKYVDSFAPTEKINISLYHELCEN